MMDARKHIFTLSSLLPQIPLSAIHPLRVRSSPSYKSPTYSHFQSNNGFIFQFLLSLTLSICSNFNLIMGQDRRIPPNLPTGYFSDASILLDLSAADDLAAFKAAVEAGVAVNGSGLWYGRRFGSRKMGFEERTPLMIAALYGSVNVLRYILGAAPAGEADRVAGSDSVSALHLAVSGGSPSSPAAVEILLAASANPNSHSFSDLISLIPKSPVAKNLRALIDGEASSSESEPASPKAFSGAALPDINTGIYGSDEFRMYSFKIKPCSRAYTHDWTECPFAHPGENARRRDPLRHQYSCVPCPEFKKGSCRKSDDCEYAHGVFESWLHPAQYRTRLCKDETGCNRKVCFFAHRKDELRPVYASTGSAIDSMAPGSPNSPPPASPKWSPPPSLQLPGASRLRSSSNARDVDLEMELFRLETQIRSLGGDLKPANLDSVFGSVNYSPNSLSPLTDPHLRQNLSHLRNSYPAPSRKLSPTELDCSPKAVAAAMLNSRAAAAFAKRSHSFVDRTNKPLVHGGGYLNGSASFVPNWGSGVGKADWSLQEGDLSKLRRSASFGQRGGNPQTAGYGGRSVAAAREELPYSAWVDQMYMEQEQMVA